MIVAIARAAFRMWPAAFCGRAYAGIARSTIIVENVSGADGSIGVGRTARAKPDGYTIDPWPLGRGIFRRHGA
jgi:hypothetical protein